ncbi:MAG: glycoside hydrolase family 127 protein, partial [Armatimonadetes bacterium]|nr:glycoside hydrolase family 127 protein [Armatimonadota bacterium]
HRGYLALRRTWSAGDVVEIYLAMPAMLMEAHPQVEADRGLLALTRGPVVYCLEAADHDVDPWNVRVAPEAILHPRWDPDLLGGVVVLEGDGAAPAEGAWDGRLYQRAGDAVLRPVKIRAIPYYAWDNREAGPMTVWLRRN